MTAPSLEMRAVEHQAVLPPAEAREPAIPADPALVRKLAALEAMARAGNARFAEAERTAATAVAAASDAAPGSERWIAAQQALSALDAARAPVRDAASAVELLRQDPAQAGSGARAAVETMAARIEAWDDAQAQATTALSARLG